MSKLCYAFFKYENKLKWVEKNNTQFEVHSNESPCRKSGRRGVGTNHLDIQLCLKKASLNIDLSRN